MDMHSTSEREGSFTINGFGLDTGLVLFFLTVEFARGVQMFSLDGALMGITILMLMVLPYFLPSENGEPSFWRWISFRSAVAATGLGLGCLLRQNAGASVSETTSFIPMTFLILTAMVSCYIQFYGLMKLRLAK